MRTKTLLAAAAMLAAGLASSMAQSNVYSLNVVGYVNKTTPGTPRYESIANPLNTTNNTYAGLFTTIPGNSQLLKWNAAIVDFDVATRTTFNTWSPASAADTTLNPGEGVLIRSGQPWTNTFVGEVLQGNLTNSFPTGYEMRASKVPQAGTATALGLTAAIPTGVAHQLLRWNSTVGTIGDWDVFNRTQFGTWSPSDPTLDVGQPFLFRAASPFNWVRNFTVQ